MTPRAGSGYDQGRHVRISREKGELMDRLAKKTSWTFRVVVEKALDELAKKEGVK